MQCRTKTQLKKLKKAEKDKAKEEKAKAEAIANTKNVFDEDEDDGGSRIQDISWAVCGYLSVKSLLLKSEMITYPYSSHQFAIFSCNAGRQGI